MLGVLLANYKEGNLEETLSIDTQMLSYVKEDLQLKKRMIDRIDKMNSVNFVRDCVYIDATSY